MTPAAAITAVLGEDLLREVFIRLPTAEDLVRAAAACTPFLRAAHNPPFLRRFRRLHRTSCSRLIGCLVVGDGRRHVNPKFVPSNPSSSKNTIWAFRLLLLPGGGWLDEYYNRWQHLDCRNGRILRKNSWSGELCVVNPAPRRYVVDLPAPLTTKQRTIIGWGLVTDDGDSSAFRVVCVSRDASASLDLRAHVLTSGGDLLSWTEVPGIPCQPDFTGGFRAMQANQSLYWRLEGGERLLAFSTATMEFSLVDLPPSLHQLSFDVVEKGSGEDEDRHVLHLLTVNDLCIETWAGTPDDGDGGRMAWWRVDKSVRFHKLVEEPYAGNERDLEVVGVAAGVVFVRRSDILFSIDLQTMNLEVLSKEGAWGVGIYPYTTTWPPSFMNPAGGQGAS